MPGWRLGALYIPLVFVVTMRTSLVAMFLMVTLADAMMVPDWSETWPDRVAVASWARTLGSPDKRIVVRKTTQRNTVVTFEIRLGSMRTSPANWRCA
jgi:hypothetical protein